MERLRPVPFSRLASKRRTAARNWQLGLMLAFVAGYVNAGGFFIVGHYTSHMTGILSELADTASSGKLATAMQLLSFILCFVVGSAFTTILVLLARRRHIHSQFSLPLLAEAIMLASVIIFGANAGSDSLHAPIIIGLLCFLMGLQNALITKASTAIVRTTHVTGLITDLGIELGRLLVGDRTLSRSRLTLFLAIITIFLTGGLLGAIAVRYFGAIGLLPVAGILIAVSLPAILRDVQFQQKLSRRHAR